MGQRTAELGSWMREWYPEIGAATGAFFLLNLAFPPFVIDDAPGRETFLGHHFLFTQSTGSISFSRWALTLVLVVLIALVAQWCARRRERDGRVESASPVSPQARVLLLVGPPLWLLVCALVAHRNPLDRVDAHLASLQGSALRLILLSRALGWALPDRSSLRLGYATFLLANLAYDAATAPAVGPSMVGLLPLYALLGAALYRFDARFLPPEPVSKVRRAAVVELSPGETSAGTEVENVPVSEGVVAATRDTAREANRDTAREAERDSSEGASEPASQSSPEEPPLQTLPEEPAVPEDPYHRYRPKV